MEKVFAIHHKKQENLPQKDMLMGMTVTQKILAAHAGLESVSAGQLIEA